jgi:hypothetical protein
LRRSHAFFLFLAVCLIVIIALFVRSERAVSGFAPTARDLAEITSALKLADISFSNDARYTRNPSQTDLFSAFQDYPGSFEHFPSGSVVSPPDFGTLGTRITVIRR